MDDFMNLYLEGERVVVDIPEVGEKTGRVGMTPDSMFTLNTGRKIYDLVKGSLFLGYAIRKTNINNRGYLRGKAPVYYQPAIRRKEERDNAK